MPDDTPQDLERHEPEDTPATPRKTFTSFLIEQGQGRLHDELTDALAELVAACVEHGKAGTLALSIHVSPSNGVCFISDAVKVKAPTGARPTSVFYPDEDGGLHRSNPAQPELPLREVPSADTPIRVAPAPPADAPLRSAAEAGGYPTPTPEDHGA